MDNYLPPQTSNHDTSPDHTEHDRIGAPRAHEAPDSVPTTPLGECRITTATARQAIEIARTLSEPMRNALTFAWTDKDGVLRLDNGVAKMRTRDALRRRELVDGFAVTDLGRAVRAVLLTSEAEVLADAERSEAEAIERMNRDFAVLPSGRYASTEVGEQHAAYRAFDWSTLGRTIDRSAGAKGQDEVAAPRQGHYNRTDDNGIVHRVDGHRRALCDIALEPRTVSAGHVMCFACIDTMFPDERDRARYLGQRPDIARAAGLKGLDAAFERAAALTESMSVEYLVRNIENRRRWAVRDAYAAEELRAYRDALHAQALVENTARTVIEVAKQLGTRYYVRRVNDSTFFVVVDADHQNRTVSGMTRDLDEAKAWQREAHRQWARRVVNERTSKSALVDTAGQRAPMRQQPERQHQAADQWPNAIEIACKAIVAYTKLSPTMRDALRGAARQAPKRALLIGWTGHVARRTKTALARRDIMRLSDNALTAFGQVVHAVAVTSDAEVLAWAGRQEAAALITECRGIVVSAGAAIATEHDPATVAFRAALLDELHTRAQAEDAERAAAKDAKPRQTCATDGHKDRPALAVHVYSHTGQGEHFGVYQCRECITCSGDCDALGDVIEVPSWMPWCRRHADAWGPGRLTGPDIVLLDSDRYHALTTEHAEHKAGVAALAAIPWLPRSAARYRALMDVRIHDNHD